MTAPKVVISGVGKEFSVSSRESVVALDGVDLTIEQNEFVALVGASGCGKSTLLYILAGLEDASTGEVLVDFEPVTGPGRDRGVVFQSYTLFPWLSVQDNVEFALRGEDLSKAERRDVAREHLQLVGLEGFASSYPSQLSGGMKQRVALARALSYKPTVLLMDEPFGALDALTRRVMQELLTRVWETHRLTVMFVTHDVDEAVYVADRVLVMSNRPGRIKSEIAIPLDRPREPSITESPEFSALRAEVFECIRDEAIESAGGTIIGA